MLGQSQIKHYTNLWCQSRGIQAEDLENHPQADDVVLLIKIREQFWNFLNKSEQGVWSAYWSSVYHKKFALKKNALTKLELITNSAIFKQQQQAKRQATIRAMRNRLQSK
jgi:hypothetical protein